MDTQRGSGAQRPLPTTGAISGALETVAFFRDPAFAARRFARLGNVFATRLLGQPLVFIRGEAAIGDLLGAGEGCEGWWPTSVRLLLGSRSLANRNGEAHRARRRVVGQLFSAAALRRYSPAIVALVEELAEDLRTAPAPVPLVERMRRFAFTVIASVVLGLEGEDRDALFADFEIWTKALFSLPWALPGSPFALALQARERLLARLTRVLQAARARAKAGLPLSGGLDLLSGGLDEAGLPLDDADLVEQLLLLLFAGYETTASSLSCLMAELLQDREALAWLRPELAGLPWPPSAGQVGSAYDAAVAPRLAAVVQEAMRLNPPVGGFFRRTTRPLVLDGVLVPEGSVVQVALAASNRFSPAPSDPGSTPADSKDPGDKTPGDFERFRPQRHLEGEAGPVLLPFGGGERVCLGKALAELEIRLMTVGLLRRLELQLAPEQDLRLQLIPSPSPRDGLRVTAVPAPGMGQDQPPLPDSP